MIRRTILCILAGILSTTTGAIRGASDGETVSPVLPVGQAASARITDALCDLPSDDGLRLQVVLDLSLFAPGKVDGIPGKFTGEAALRWIARRFTTSPQVLTEPELNVGLWALLREARSLPSPTVTYTVTGEDTASLGPLPDSPAARAGLDSLPYTSTAERLAERFHTDLSTLTRLNPGVRISTLASGQTLVVPAVVPFHFPDDVPSSSASVEDREGIQIVILHRSRLLEVLNSEDHLLAAFPITVGNKSHHLRPGTWHIISAVPHPEFRYDTALLETGVRGKEFHLLPPGPNSPVGVLWFGLAPSDPGVPDAAIGIHGTGSPATIGRSSSSGCIRLANWDIVRFAGFAGIGTTVRWEDR